MKTTRTKRAQQLLELLGYAAPDPNFRGATIIACAWLEREERIVLRRVPLVHVPDAFFDNQEPQTEHSRACVRAGPNYCIPSCPVLAAWLAAGKPVT